MSDEPTAPDESADETTAESSAEPSETSAGPSASDAWKDVVARMAEFGAAISRWAKSAADDPENRARLEQLKSGMNDIARKTDAAFSSAMDSDFGRQVQQGAEQAGKAIGDAAQEISQAAAPHVATAFAGLAEMFGKAAAKIDEAARQREESESAEAAGGGSAAAPEESSSEEPSTGDEQS